MSEVVRRTAYYETIKRGDVVIVRWMPFYRVTIPGLSGKVFEPVDCFRTTMSGEEVTGSSQLSIKDVNDWSEVNWRALTTCEKSPDGTIVTLHSFEWDWPK